MMLARMAQHRKAPRAPILALLLGGIAAFLAPASPASAHAVVIGTTPESGALLDQTPAEVMVSFNEDVSIESDSIIVIDADGTVVSDAATGGGSTISAAIDPATTGWHAVSWWAVSADGHPVSGAWTFRIGAGDELAPEGLEGQAAAAATPGLGARWAFTIAQWASTLAAVVATGTIFVMVVLGHRRTLFPLALGASAIGSVLALITAATNGPYTAVSLSWFAGPASDHHLGRAALLAVATLALAATRSSRADGADRWFASGILVLVTAALCVPVLVGHTSTSGGAATVGVMSHLVLGGAWLGATPAVLLLLRRGAPAQMVLSKFSRAATWLLALTLVAGTVSAGVLSGGPGNMARSWGFALFAKVTLVGVAITAGAWNRWNVAPHADKLPTRQAHGALIVEVVALALIVAASVALTHNGPPRADLGMSEGPVVIDEAVDDLRFQLIIDPARVGSNEIHLFILDAAGVPQAVEEATVTLSSEDLGVGRIEQSLTNLGAGHFMGTTADLGLAGTWKAHVVVRPDPFSHSELTETFRVR